MQYHRWVYCNHCKTKTVICGSCGNNCCNGGYGEVMGKEPGTSMPCPECPSAYEMLFKGYKENNG